MIALIAFVLTALHQSNTNLSIFFLHRQDRWLLLGGATLLGLCLWRLRDHSAHLSGTWRLALLIGGIMALAAFAGHYWILSGYDMSRDEQMATFDAAVFAGGSLAAPLPELWRDHAEALNTMFIYPAEQHAAWVSQYLPLNAAFRALIGSIATPALTGPLMTLIGALALWGCTRRIWPEDRESSVVGLLMFVGSGQILVTGMTAYAMPAHLALNLIWLWLFLRRSRSSDAAALAIGFLAVGLHQPIMHPMFAGPILFLLLLEKDWRRAAIYVLGYSAIGAFWLWWPNWTWTLVEANALAPKADGVDYVTRLMMAVLAGDGLGIVNMMANLLRFIAWQHLLLIPLLLLGAKVARKNRLAGALAGGVLLTIAVMTVILPYQGHGFGYRYLHGLIGNCILLAIFGWKSLGEDIGKWRALMLRTTAASLALLLPVQAWMAHRFYAPYARVSTRIDQSSANYAVIGEADAPFSADLVINSPHLDKRPLRLLRGELDPALTRLICTDRPTVALVGDRLLKPIIAFYGFAPLTPTGETNQALTSRLRRTGCTVMILE